jgi:integrase
MTPPDQLPAIITPGALATPAGWTVRLHEKGGKEHAMPCHHALAEALRAYIGAAGIAEGRKGWLFRTARGHKPIRYPTAP